MTAERSKYYPVFIDLRGKRCLVVGAGRVAARKIEALLESGAAVRVVSPAAEDEVRRLAGEGRISLEARDFEERDLEGSFLVIGATDDPEVNRRVHAAAEERSMLVNIVDVPEICNFIVPSVLRRGEFQIAVSSGGASPFLARRVREALEKRFGCQYPEIVDELSALRDEIKQRLPDIRQRRKFWSEITDLDFFDSLDPGEVRDKLRKRAEQCLSQLEDSITG